MNKQYTLIISGSSSFSLSNDTDSDPQSDYSPGIWAIKTQKAILKYARELIAQGDNVKIKDYDNASHHALANQFIKELGLDQPLFKEPLPIIKSFATIAGLPNNLSQLKKFLTVGKKIKSINYFENGTDIRERETFVVESHNDSVVFDKAGGKSWFYLGKASEWTFDNGGATKWHIDRAGVNQMSQRIGYIINQ